MAEASPFGPPEGDPLPPTELITLAADQSDPPLEDRLTIFQLRPSLCHFPLGENPTLFCGRPVCDRGAGVYCEHHADRCYAGRVPKPIRADDKRRLNKFQGQKEKVNADD
jgi:hypothetical protein